MNNHLFYSPIKKNNYKIFQSSYEKKNQNKPQTSRKQDCTLFSNLFILCQTRQLDLDDFFKLESQACPLSIRTDGELYKGTKSDIVSILKDVCKTQLYDIQPKTNFLLIYGAMFVHANLLATETFFEYSKSFTIKIEKRTKKQFRVDIIFDQYNDESLKSHTGNIRGDGR